MSELKLAVYGYGTNAGKAFFEALNDSDINCTDVCPLAYGAGEYDAVNIMDRNFGIVSPDVYDFESANVFISFINFFILSTLLESKSSSTLSASSSFSSLPSFSSRSIISKVSGSL